MKIKYLIYSLPLFLFSCQSSGTKSEETQEEVVQEETSEESVSTEIEVAETAVFFTNLTDGSDVKNPISIEMGVKGMALEPKGPINENAGHHHLIIDGTFVPSGEIVPTSETSIHYGGGQSEGSVTLSPGTHTLTLQFADGAHSSYGEAMSSTITVNVIE